MLWSKSQIGKIFFYIKGIKLPLKSILGSFPYYYATLAACAPGLKTIEI
jgi:hypothetical protein